LIQLRETFGIFFRIFRSHLSPGTCFKMCCALKHDRMVGTMENRSCIVFGPNEPNREGAGVTRFPEFLENESLTTDFTEIQ